MKLAMMKYDTILPIWKKPNILPMIGHLYSEDIILILENQKPVYFNFIKVLSRLGIGYILQRAIKAI